jgi:pimeloyl-ACP methyl ester carboxylesterase
VTDRMVVGSDGRRVAWREFGDPAGRPMLLMHGTPGSRLMPRATRQACERLGIRAVAFDRPGYGGSDRWPGHRVADVVPAAVAVAEAAGIGRFAVYGRSGGGPYALACAAVLGDRVTGVGVGVGLAPRSMPGWFDGVNELNRRLWAAAEESEKAFTEATAELVTLLRDDPDAYTARIVAPMSPADRALLARDPWRMADRVAGMAEALRPGPGGWYDDAESFRVPWGFELSAVRQRVHLWYGRHDTNVPAPHGEYLARHLPSASLSWPETAGHLADRDEVAGQLTAVLNGTSS